MAFGEVRNRRNVEVSKDEQMTDDELIDLGPRKSASVRARRNTWADNLKVPPIPLRDAPIWIRLELPKSWLTVLRDTGKPLDEQLHLAVQKYGGLNSIKVLQDCATITVRSKELSLWCATRQGQKEVVQALGHYVAELEDHQ